MDGPLVAADALQYPDKLDIAAFVVQYLGSPRKMLDKLKEVKLNALSTTYRPNSSIRRAVDRQQESDHDSLEVHGPNSSIVLDNDDSSQDAFEAFDLNALVSIGTSPGDGLVKIWIGPGRYVLVSIGISPGDGLVKIWIAPGQHAPHRAEATQSMARNALSTDDFARRCICGQCSEEDCAPMLNLLRWITRRTLYEQRWRQPPRLGIGGTLVSAIVDDEESSGLDFVESVLPFEKYTAGEQATCATCKGLGSFLSGLTASFEPSKLAISLYRVKAAAMHCNFCKLLCVAGAEFVRPYPLYCFRSSRYELRLRAVGCFLEIANMGGARSSSGGIGDRQCVRIHFSPPPFPLQRDNADFMILHSIALSSAGASFTSGRTVDKSQIRLPMLKAWISECVASHGVMCNGFHLPNADGKLRSLRLVDVNTYSIVRQHSSSRYIALSYVWGEASSLQLTRENENDLCRPGALWSHISEIPQTFKDAFEVVMSIGERYIWIDALCITQDAEDKEAHLQDMHLVYGAALFTLVAGGDDANAGLPGVRPWSRSRAQIYERLRPEIGIAVSMPLPANLKTSRWSSRAWTYQEQLLSKRFLIFFDEQVLWQCPSVVQCEDTLADNKNAAYERLKHLSSSGLNRDDPFKRTIQSGFQRLPAFQRYADIVSEYTGRELRFSEDILQAFSGISKIFMLDLNTDMVEGLPVSFLDAAILWQPTVPLHRRRGNERFASWSWAGWEGRVRYEETKERYEAEGLLPIIRWNLHRTELVNRYGVGIKPYLFSPGIERRNWVSPFEPNVDHHVMTDPT